MSVPSSAVDKPLLTPHCSATTGGKDGAEGHNGGVFEWTSTALAEHDGFITSQLYPGSVLSHVRAVSS